MEVWENPHGENESCLLDECDRDAYSVVARVKGVIWQEDKLMRLELMSNEDDVTCYILDYINMCHRLILPLCESCVVV